MKHNNGLKPCPFCGGVALLNANCNYRTGNYLVFVECDVCGARGKAYISLGDPGDPDLNVHPYMDAAEVWNMRAKNKAMAARNMMRVLDPLA